MNQPTRWILCAALCCAVVSCDGKPGKPGETQQTPSGDNAGSPKTMSGVSISMETPADVAAAPSDAKRTTNGVAYKVLQEGRSDGKSAKAWDKVNVHYSGWTTDGKLFDSSLKTGAPASFALNGVIKGWTEGLQVMKEGDATRFWIPESLAYAGAAGRPQGMLVFDVELLSVIQQPKPPEPPKAPADVARPPADAKRTRRGVHYKVLRPGTGTRHPKATEKVEVHYSGWTTDGKLFDSSVQRGEKASFGLNEVIPGWTEGIQKMVVGEKTRFWIPRHLAYDGQPGRPQGMLVFDVELFGIR